MKFLKLFSILLILPVTFLFAQDEAEVEEVVVVGSQIKGAKITGALPVSVITAEDIESLAVESGEELFQNLAENGNNNFNQTDFSGGYNASRGDVGSLDLRNIGTGNTLTLLNGRRLVQSPGYATEWVGGSFVPVSSVNSNTIPVYGADRVEILRDGASAIYGADAVSGVINTVLKDDFEGLTMRVRQNWYDSFEAKDNKVSIQWGKDFANGTNVSVYFDRYDRERIRALEDPKWSAGDLRPFLPDPDEGGLGAYNDTTWRNTNVRSEWAQFYNASGNGFSLYPYSDSFCGRGGSNDFVFPGYEEVFCLYDATSIRDSLRANYATTYDKRGPLLRNNIVVFVNTELDNGMEAYTEVSYYTSDINRVLYGGAMLGLGSSSKGGGNSQPMFIPATNYWLSQFYRRDRGPDYDSDDLFINSSDMKKFDSSDTTGASEGLFARYHRFLTPRSYDSKRETFRLVQGLRGSFETWDWDSGFVISRATSEMDNHGRVDLNAMDAALADTTPNAYNPFCAGILPCNEEQIMTSIYRDNTTELMMVDFKMSNPSVYTLPAGDIGMLVGAEVRYESHDDARDPNIDGTVYYRPPYPASNRPEPPYISNIANSSPSPNTFGERTVTSMFVELQVPLHETLDSQIAIRAENADDFGSNVVGKVALGYVPNSIIKVRASSSTTFRAPNLITLNEGLVVRNNSQEDPLLTYAMQAYYASVASSGTAPQDGDGNYLCSGDDEFSGGTCAQDTFPNYSMQRQARGNEDLQAEESTNTSLGIVLTPTDNLVITVDKWEIAQENTVGLFGERNHLLLDTLIRARGGVNECVGNPLVIRNPYVAENDPSDDAYNAAWDSNLCLAGNVVSIADVYINLDDKNLKGTDYLVEYFVDTDFGSFSTKLMRVQFDEYTQEAGGVLAELIEEGQTGGILDGLITTAGYGDLIGTYDRRAYPEYKDSFKVSWKHKQWDVFLSGTQIASFTENGVTNNAKDSSGNYVCSGTESYSGGTCGEDWEVASMLTMNLTVGYKFKNGLRLRGTVRNLEDERAPLADETTWGYVADVHQDYGRNYTIEFYKKF